MTATVDGNDEGLLQFLYGAPIGLLQTSLDGTVEMMNPKSAQLLMPITPSGELDNLFDALEPVVPHLRTLVAAFCAPNGVVCESLRFPVEGPQWPTARIYAVSVLKLDGARLMVVLADASIEARRESDELNEQLHQAARIDQLTRMPNRVALAESMQAEWTAPDHAVRTHASLLLIGCERLVEIGAGFGEDVKNQVLALMARRLRSALRPSDAFGPADSLDAVAARISSDEFVVLLRLSDPGDVTLVAQRVLDALGRPYAVESRSLHCSVSIGIVHRPADGGVVDDAFRDAGIAMQEAKRVGGSRWVVFDPAMRERAVRRGSIETDLRRALTNEELFVVYQPIVWLQPDAPGSIAGVEALVRWRHPQRDVVAPIEFIGVAEETGLINALGSFVLYAACRQFVAWVDALGEQAPGLLAVNLSRAQLADPTLVDLVRTTLVATGMAPGRLQLEVTETLAAQDDAVQAQLHALKALGIQLALDDFGTGYSSLSSLHLLPVDTVKIDRSFVTLAETSPHHCVLIESTIRVAKSLGMRTVAEGIETDGQHAIVRALGCDKAQGYRYSRPLGAELVPGWIAALA